METGSAKSLQKSPATFLGTHDGSQWFISADHNATHLEELSIMKHHMLDN